MASLAGIDLPSKGTRQGRATEKDGDPCCALFGLVPKAQVEYHTGEDTSLESPKEEAHDSHLGEVMSSGNSGTEASEAKDKESKPPDTQTLSEDGR